MATLVHLLYNTSWLCQSVLYDVNCLGMLLVCILVLILYLTGTSGLTGASGQTEASGPEKLSIVFC